MLRMMPSWRCLSAEFPRRTVMASMSAGSVPHCHRWLGHCGNSDRPSLRSQDDTYRLPLIPVPPPTPHRAISVILGDKWKKMKNEERKLYTMEAKALAEEQKRLNPDCWKRKRTNSVSTVPSLRPLIGQNCAVVGSEWFYPLPVTQTLSQD